MSAIGSRPDGSIAISGFGHAGRRGALSTMAALLLMLGQTYIVRGLTASALE